MNEVLIYFGLIALWSFCVTYLFLFVLLPAFSVRVGLKAKPLPPHVIQAAPPSHPVHSSHGPALRRSTGFSRIEGFKSLAQGTALTVDDIVKGLSRN